MFELHEQLQKDSIEVGQFKLCRLLLMNDSNYPWFILVPQRAGITELHHLSEQDRIELINESAYLSEKLADFFKADKLNVAMLGNLVPQLHMHHVVRFKHDPVWPKPVWGQLPSQPYAPEVAAEIISKIKTLLSERLTDEASGDSGAYY